MRSWCRITAETLSVFKQINRTLASTDFSGTQYKMTAQKEQKKPSFPLILSVLSIVFYCAGFLRVELDLNEQKKRINALESIEEAKSHTNILDLVTKSKEINPGKFLTKLLKKKKTLRFKTTYTATIYQTNMIVWTFIVLTAAR